MATTEEYLTALEERFGASLGKFEDGAVSAVLNGRRSITITFDEAAKRATLTTPLNGTSRSLPSALLCELLKRNFPDSSMAGSLLCAAPDGESLVMVNAIRFCSAEPALLAGIAAAQAQAAQTLAAWIMARLEGQGGGLDDDNDEGDYDYEADDQQGWSSSLIDRMRQDPRDAAPIDRKQDS